MAMKKENKIFSNNSKCLRTCDEISYPGQALEGKYGFCKFTPNCLQFCNNPTGFLVVMSIYYVAHGLLSNGIFSVIITTLERRFGLDSSETGFIASCYDISYFVFCLFLTFYANRGHRSRMLAIGSILYGIGVLIFVLPHFTTGLYQYGEAKSPFCNANRTSECGKGGTLKDLHSYYYIFIFAMLLQGIGCVPLYTVTFPILEDSLPKRKSPLYLGIANAMTLIGPIIGYITGGYLLGIYVDFDDPTSTGGKDLEIDDPRWVGAWWIGYLITSTICIVFIAPVLFGFPRQFPGSAKIRAQRKSEVHAGAGEDIARQENFGKSIKDMPVAILMLLKNPTFMFTSLATSTLGHLIGGYGAFLPKLIQNQYHASAKNAALLSGAISLPGGVIGCVCGGIMASKLNLTTRGLLKFSTTSMFLLTFLTLIPLLYCPNSLVAGATTPYVQADVKISRTNLTSLCNDQCNCQQKYFSPVCADSVNYFSACHAGCSDFNRTSKKFMKCSCVLNGTQTATAGICKDSCNAVVPFFAVTFVAVVTWFAVSTPAQLVLMRSVPDSQRSLAMGVQIFLIRAVGSIPGPIVFGAIFDSTCILWQKNECEEENGSCYMYNSKQLAMSITFIGLAAQTLTCTMFYLALKLYKTAEDKHEPSSNDGDSSDRGNVDGNHLSRSTNTDFQNANNNENISKAFMSTTF